MLFSRPNEQGSWINFLLSVMINDNADWRKGIRLDHCLLFMRKFVNNHAGTADSGVPMFIKLRCSDCPQALADHWLMCMTCGQHLIVRQMILQNTAGSNATLTTSCPAFNLATAAATVVFDAAQPDLGYYSIRVCSLWTIRQQRFLFNAVVRLCNVPHCPIKISLGV